MQVEKTGEARTVEASAEELAAWEKYKAEAQIKSILFKKLPQWF